MLSLADRANDKAGMRCTSSYRDIEERTNLGRSTVIRTVQSLAEQGLIQSKHRNIDGQNTSNVYVVMVPDGWSQNGTRGSRSGTGVVPERSFGGPAAGPKPIEPILNPAAAPREARKRMGTPALIGETLSKLRTEK